MSFRAINNSADADMARKSHKNIIKATLYI